MINRISNALLRRILYPVTAIVAMDENGRVLRVDVFDSGYGVRRLRLGSKVKGITFVSNHPSGWRKLDAQDRINLARVVTLSQGLPVRVYLCSEEFACFEVDRAEFCDIIEGTSNPKGGISD